jgi:hypothetical protein
VVRSLLEQALSETDECTDEELSSVIGSLNCERHGFIRPSDYVNTDEAMRMLHLSSRNKFFEVARSLGIESRRVNNQPIGFHKSDIGRMYEEIHKKSKTFL